MSSEFEKNFQQGTRLLHQGKAKEALPFLEVAHKLKPNDVDGAINLSGALILVKKFIKASEILEPFSESHADHVMVWINLGAAYLGNPVLAREDEQTQAIAAFEKALEIDPVAPSVAYNIGLIYEDRNQIEIAIGWFKRAIQANPGDVDAHRKVRRLHSSLDKEDGDNQ